MADVNNKTAKNVSGKYYVDAGCISCGQCVDLAPENFAEDAENGGMYVAKQPTDDELAACQQAKDACPVEAIGDDGE